MRTSDHYQSGLEVAVLTLTPAAIALFAWAAPSLVTQVHRGDPASMVLALVAVFATAVLCWHTFSLLAAWGAAFRYFPGWIRRILHSIVKHLGTHQAKAFLYRHTAATAIATSLLSGVGTGAMAAPAAPVTVAAETTPSTDIPEDLAWGGPPLAPQSGVETPAEQPISGTSHSPAAPDGPDSTPQHSARTSPPMSASPTPTVSAKLSPLSAPIASANSAKTNTASSAPTWLPRHAGAPSPSATTPLPAGSPRTIPAHAVPTHIDLELESMFQKATPSLQSHSSTASHHVVQAGESLWSISRTLTDSDAQAAALWPRIFEANHNTIGSDPGLIRPGVQLTIPEVTP